MRPYERQLNAISCLWLAWLISSCAQEAIAQLLDSSGLLPAQDPVPPGTVEVATYKAGYERARTEAELAQLFRDNLEPDLAPFRRSTHWNISEFVSFVRRFNATVPRHPLGEGNAALVVIRNGTVGVHWLRGSDNHWRFACIKAAIERARTLRFPNTAFILNNDDFPICTGTRCPLPVFTMYKKWRAGRNYDTNEVLMPVMNHHYEDMYSFPWHKKRGKMFMRASQQGCMPINSSRVELAMLSEKHPQMLDLGITRIDGADKHTLKYMFGRASYVSIEDHAKWKYLVSADGCVAQTRLAKVMLSNSVVVKEDSDWIEYYYRSLRPWQHYVPFGSLDSKLSISEEILQLTMQLQHQDARAQRIADTAQKWAYKYLSQFPRLLYIKRELAEYNALFGGAMEEWVESNGPELLFKRPVGSEQYGARQQYKRHRRRQHDDSQQPRRRFRLGAKKKAAA